MNYALTTLIKLELSNFFNVLLHYQYAFRYNFISAAKQILRLRFLSNSTTSSVFLFLFNAFAVVLVDQLISYCLDVYRGSVSVVLYVHLNVLLMVSAVLESHSIIWKYQSCLLVLSSSQFRMINKAQKFIWSVEFSQQKQIPKAVLLQIRILPILSLMGLQTKVYRLEFLVLFVLFRSIQLLLARTRILLSKKITGLVLIKTSAPS